MKISVVIPAYNEEDYLPKTLASIGKLKRKPDELIIVDGGSSDRTGQIAKARGAKVLSVKRKTIGYARQQGLLAATGDIVACTDADDILPSDWLEKIEEALTRPGVSAVYGDYRFYDGPWWYRLYVNHVQPSVFSFFNLVAFDQAPGQNIAFWRKKALAVGGFPENFRSVEDVEMIKRLRTVGKIVYLRNNSVLTSGRRGKEGIRTLFTRVLPGLLRYYMTGKADTFDFPNLR